MTYPRPSTSAPTADGASAFGPAAEVSPSPRVPEIERDILDFWSRDDTFRASIARREGAEEWVFYDGPPFANGLPHYGHLLTGYAKDLFPRFQTMRDKKVDRVFGWDTHGLPAELEAMKQLGITEKSEIEQMGIAAFNAKARESVLEYTQQWEDYVTRRTKMAEDKITQAETVALQEVRSLSADVAIAAAEKILSAKLKGEAAAGLVEKAIGEVRSRLN